MILVIDFETTGLDPDYHEPCQFAAVLLDDELTAIASASSLIKIEHENRVSREALNIQRRKIGQFANAPDSRFAAKLLAEVVGLAPQPVMLAGHNIQFDFAFLQRFQSRNEFLLPLSPTLLDSNTLARFAIGSCGLVENTRLTTLSNYFGIRHQAHDALGDAIATVEVLKCLKRDFPALYALAEQGKLYDDLLEKASIADPNSAFVATCRSQLNSRSFLSNKQIAILLAMINQE